MDLSKDFDTKKYDFLAAKLYTSGFNKGSRKVLHSFSSNRWHKKKNKQAIQFMARVDSRSAASIFSESSSF